MRGISIPLLLYPKTWKILPVTSGSSCESKRICSHNLIGVARKKLKLNDIDDMEYITSKDTKKKQQNKKKANKSNQKE